MTTADRPRVLFVTSNDVTTTTRVRRNVCGCETYPLLKTINRVLGRLPGPGPDCYLDEDRRDDLDGVVIDNNEIGYAEEDGGGRAQCTEPLLKGHPTDCGKYVICEFGTLREQPCPSSLHFNKVSRRPLGALTVFPGATPRALEVRRGPVPIEIPSFRPYRCVTVWSGGRSSTA